jgi:hypothetical protein
VIIDIDLTGEHATVQLLEPEDCKRFHLAVRGGDLEMLGAVLPGRGLGYLLPSGDAMIKIEGVRGLAAGRVPDGWDEDFAAMVGYAKSKGWLDESGEEIQAHVEWAS